MGLNNKPMVEVHHRLASDFKERSRRTEQAEKDISGATLGQIRLAGIGKEGDRLQGNCLSTSGEHPHNEAIPNNQPSQEAQFTS